jgi:uncharacterized membrane protein YfcA
LKRAAALSLTLGVAAAAAGVGSLVTGWVELFRLAAIPATFTFLIAWMNRGLVGPREGRALLVGGVALAVVGVVTGAGSLMTDIAA